ncbi:MAG: SDR family NAD(P)-dependent oxidoreductase [Clostridia bacterium]|nr:SDR family NAD(P)-dependent oxidoreductase [Clostridia bacterium]
MDNYKNKMVLLTGFSGSIGYNLALEICRSGAKLIATDKSIELVERAKNRLLKEFDFAQIETFVCDYTNINNIKELAQNVKQYLGETPLDFIFHCAGVFNKWQKLSDQGLEMQFQINYLAPYMLTELLKKNLLKSEYSRIVFLRTKFMSAQFSEKYFELQNYKSINAYAFSKNCATLYALYLNQNNPENIRAIVITPKITNSNFFIKNNFGFSKYFFEKIKEMFVLPSQCAMDISEAVKTSVNTGAVKLSGRNPKRNRFSEQELDNSKILIDYSNKFVDIDKK